MAIGIALLVLFFLLITFGVVKVIYGTISKNKWGVNVAAQPCPQCHTPKPLVRKPANLRQVMWGGSTCAVCGLETDKWGRPVAMRK